MQTVIQATLPCRDCQKRHPGSRRLRAMFGPGGVDIAPGSQNHLQNGPGSNSN